MTATQTAPLPGQYFDMPGVPGGSTQWTHQDDTTVNLSTTINPAAQVPVTNITAYKQVDVVADWFLCMNVTQAITTGSSTVTTSAYAPFNQIGPVKQLIQNQYASVDVENGIDLYIFSLIRPYNLSEMVSGVNNYSNPAGDPVAGTATGYLTTALAQVNQINSAAFSSATTNYNLVLRLPAGQWFDRYYDLTIDGTPTTQGHPALVSPQYMAGTTRVITPVIALNQGGTGAPTTDLAPFSISAGSGTATGTALTRIRRRSIYAGNPQVSPPVYAWQYRQKTQRYSLAGQSRVDLQLPLDTGQLLACYVRMFDPAAAGGLGAPININVVSRISLQYGSGLFWHDAQTFGAGPNAAALVQREWLTKHNSMLPAGVLAYDLALDERGQMTNARALNTLTTAGILVHIEFTAAQSASSYVVLGTESLVYVS